MVHTPDNVKEAIRADTERTLTLTGMACGTLIVLALLGSLTYCGSQPDATIALQRECRDKGGSWLPVRDARGFTESTCVMPAMIPLVEKMNAAD